MAGNDLANSDLAAGNLETGSGSLAGCPPSDATFVGAPAYHDAYEDHELSPITQPSGLSANTSLAPAFGLPLGGTLFGGGASLVTIDYAISNSVVTTVFVVVQPARFGIDPYAQAPVPQSQPSHAKSDMPGDLDVQNNAYNHADEGPESAPPSAAQPPRSALVPGAVAAPGAMPVMAHVSTTAAELGVADSTAAATASAATAHATGALLLPGTGATARAGGDAVGGTPLAAGTIPHLDSHAVPGGGDPVDGADGLGGFDHRAVARPQVVTMREALAPAVSFAPSTVEAALFGRPGLMASMAVNFEAVDTAIDAVMNDMEKLGNHVALWFEELNAEPYALATSVAIVAALGGRAYLKRRGRGAVEEFGEEESSSWLFTRLHHTTV